MVFCKHALKYSKKVGPHQGEYCKVCGKWLRWVKKPLNSDDGQTLGAAKEVRRWDKKWWRSSR